MSNKSHFLMLRAEHWCPMPVWACEEMPASVDIQNLCPPIQLSANIMKLLCSRLCLYKIDETNICPFDEQKTAKGSKCAKYDFQITTLITYTERYMDGRADLFGGKCYFSKQVRQSVSIVGR